MGSNYMKSTTLSAPSNLGRLETLSLAEELPRVSDKLKSKPAEMDDIKKVAKIEAVAGSCVLEDNLDTSVTERDHLYSLLTTHNGERERFMRKILDYRASPRHSQPKMQGNY